MRRCEPNTYQAHSGWVRIGTCAPEPAGACPPLSSPPAAGLYLLRAGANASAFIHAWAAFVTAECKGHDQVGRALRWVFTVLTDSESAPLRTTSGAHGLDPASPLSEGAAAPDPPAGLRPGADPHLGPSCRSGPPQAPAAKRSLPCCCSLSPSPPQACAYELLRTKDMRRPEGAEEGLWRTWHDRVAVGIVPTRCGGPACRGVGASAARAAQQAGGPRHAHQARDPASPQCTSGARHELLGSAWLDGWVAGGRAACSLGPGAAPALAGSCVQPSPDCLFLFPLRATGRCTLWQPVHERPRSTCTCNFHPL